MASHTEFTDEELVHAARGFWWVFDGFHDRLSAALRSLPSVDADLDARLQAADPQYVRRLKAIEDAGGRDAAKLMQRAAPGSGDDGARAKLVDRILEMMTRDARARARAFDAARKRHQEIKRPEGRPRRSPETLLARGLRLQRQQHRRGSRRKYNRVWFIERIRARLEANRSLSIAEAIRQDALREGYTLSPNRVEWLRKRFYEWDIEVPNPSDRS